MKTTFLLLFTLSSMQLAVFAQPTIQCPNDVTVHLFDLDKNYTSYGDPVVSAEGDFEIVSNLTVIDSPCDGSTTTIHYTVLEFSSGSVAKCNQVISITTPVLDDVIFPEPSVIIPLGNIEDTRPELTGTPEPKEHINQGSNIYSTWADQIINGSPLKVIRTWTCLDWCTGNTISFVQVITVEELVEVAGLLTVNTCNIKTTIIENVNVTTDELGFNLNLNGCEIENNDLVAYLNCIASQNNLQPNSKLILELQSQGSYLNGMTTLDMVLIQRHILGILPFSTFCQIEAADVNNDGRISAIDLVAMRKLILGMVSSIPNSSSWRFYKDNTGGDLNFKKSEFPLTELNIIGVKVGDVNGSAAGN